MNAPSSPLQQEAAFLARLGERVRAWRAEHGRTRKALAAASGVSERYLAQLESGEGNISVLLLRRIAHAMSVPVEELIGTNGRRVPTQLYNGYGDGPPQGSGVDQGRFQMEGNAYLKAEFPRLDYIKSEKRRAEFLAVAAEVEDARVHEPVARTNAAPDRAKNRHDEPQGERGAGEAGVGDRARCAARRHELEAEVVQAAGEVDEPRLVPDREQCALCRHDPSSSMSVRTTCG